MITFHDKSHTAEYRAWADMKQRCNNPKNKRFKDYGGRGIVVCPEWSGSNGFQSFFNSLGGRPSDAHSLDRVDNDLHYTPDNCRWATTTVQGENRRTTKLSVDKVEAIKALHSLGFSIAHLARLNGVGSTIISNIVHGKKWVRDENKSSTS